MFLSLYSIMFFMPVSCCELTRLRIGTISLSIFHVKGMLGSISNWNGSGQRTAKHVAT